MLKTKAQFETLDEILQSLGGIHPRRVRAWPPPGSAREKDVTWIQDRENRTCELVDGTLVEKTVGVTESFLAMHLGHLLQLFLDRNDLGLLFGEAGTMRILKRQVRAADVAFVSWARLPTRMLPTKAIPDLVPDLAVEVISKGNTRREMTRRLRDYFKAGVRLVWYVFPKTRTVRVYTAPKASTLFHEGDALDGGDVLPGLSLRVADIFARMPPPPAKKKRRKSK